MASSFSKNPPLPKSIPSTIYRINDTNKNGRINRIDNPDTVEPDTVNEEVPSEDVGRMVTPEQCIRLFAPSAVTNVKSRLNQRKADRFTVEIVLQREEDRDIRFHS